MEMSLNSVLLRMGVFSNIRKVYKHSSLPKLNLYVLNKKLSCLHLLIGTRILHNSSVMNYCEIAGNTSETVGKEKCEKILSHYGFKRKNLISFLRNCPDISQLSDEKLVDNLETWSNCQFGDKCLISLLTRHPNLIFMPTKFITRAYIFLSSRYNNNEIYETFLNSPLILLDNEETIEEKFAYLEIVMEIPRSQILHSSALGYPLKHIRVRHEFLKRVGVYKVLDKKNNIGHVNPKLDIIVSSIDKDFATKVAGVTLLEYEVFKDLLSKEEDD